MDIPEELQDWVAHEGQEPAVVVNPCYIPHTAVEDLAFYHPGFGGTTPQAMRHVYGGLDDNQRPYARVDSLSYNWHEKMVQVMRALRLFPDQEQGRSVLIDDQIGAHSPEMHGWRVTHWKVVKGRDSNMEVVHQDFITWEKPGEDNVVSIFSWLPYATAQMQPFSKGLVVNERPISLQVSRWQASRMG